MRMMLVTDQYPPTVGGVPTTTHNLARDLDRRGHRVTVVAPSTTMRDEEGVEDGLRVVRFASFEWPVVEGQRIPFPSLPGVRQLVAREDPEVVHVHSAVTLGQAAQRAAARLGKPVVATNHYLPVNVFWSLAGSASFSRGVYAYLLRFYNRCAYVTTPSRAALHLLQAHCLQAPARVISNGIDLGAFAPGPRDPAIRRKLGLPADRPLALHVNRLSEEKRVDVLLRAAARMRGDGHIALAGAGPAEAELHARAERLGLGDRVSFLGFVPGADLLALRRAADVFVIPSEAELQSIATMEAMACGLPVVAADAYALPELVRHGENGYLFEPGNDEELACYLDRLLADPETRACMGAASLRVIAPHDRRLVLAQWESLYSKLAAAAAVSPAIARQARAQARRSATSKGAGRAPRTTRKPGKPRAGDSAAARWLARQFAYGMSATRLGDEP